MKQRAAISILCLLCACGCGKTDSNMSASPVGNSEASPVAAHFVPTGTWGGTNIQVITRADGGEVRFGCFQGHFDQMISTDDQGQFSSLGDVVDTSGPLTPEHPHVKHSAQFSGAVTDNVMEITASFTDDQNQLHRDRFRAAYGNQGELQVCPF